MLGIGREMSSDLAGSSDTISMDGTLMIGKDCVRSFERNLSSAASRRAMLAGSSLIVISGIGGVGVTG